MYYVGTYICQLLGWIREIIYLILGKGEPAYERTRRMKSGYIYFIVASSNFFRKAST